jgi:guanylate kinase
MEKLITISGPRGAGKDTIQQRIVEIFAPLMHRVLLVNTRAKRTYEVEGKEYLRFITDQEFDQIDNSGGFAFKSFAFPPYRAAIPWSELDSEVGILNMIPNDALDMHGFIRGRGGRALGIVLLASDDECRNHIKNRQPTLTTDELDALVKADPASYKAQDYKGFDAIIYNEEGNIEKVVKEIEALVKKFIAG